jgi:tRNA(Ile2) C34 agmatinyltransferase TiaS
MQKCCGCNDDFNPDNKLDFFCKKCNRIRKKQKPILERIDRDLASGKYKKEKK